MALKIINDAAFRDRKPAKLPPKTTLSDATLKTWKGGMVIREQADGSHVLADGAAFVPDPKFLLIGGDASDVLAARSIGYVEGPDTFKINNEAFVGNPVAGDELAIGTGGNVGKLVVVASTTPALLSAKVANVTKAADADGFITIKVVR
jgi:hypothetical protein